MSFISLFIRRENKSLYMFQWPLEKFQRQIKVKKVFIQNLSWGLSKTSEGFRQLTKWDHHHEIILNCPFNHSDDKISKANTESCRVVSKTWGNRLLKIQRAELLMKITLSTGNYSHKTPHLCFLGRLLKSYQEKPFAISYQQLTDSRRKGCPFSR